ncbi:MAG: hypothetical protein H8E27_15300 [Verrucomicrobia subdivision 3 bacterium]|nr:hypothetical protein [Limisphaerales bacterium]
MSDVETGCCPRFNPALWDHQILEWTNKSFVRDTVRCLFHIPLNFGGVMASNVERIEAAKVKDPEMIVLSDECSLWKSVVYISVSGDLPGADNVKLSGRFMSRVFEGHYRHAGQWAKEMAGHVAEKNETLKRQLFYYTTCPKCAETYGKNYVVLLAEI